MQAIEILNLENKNLKKEIDSVYQENKILLDQVNDFEDKINEIIFKNKEEKIRFDEEILKVKKKKKLLFFLKINIYSQIFNRIF
jgi:hypothetical protein